MIKTAIIGYGNIGKAAVDAISAAPDFELSGIVSRSLEKGALGEIPIVKSIDELGETGLAILCVPSRNVPEIAEELLLKGYSTVDCFDMHQQIFDLYTRLDKAAKKGNACCVTAVGFDPGLDSAVRALFEAAAPKGLTYTDFGPGMSMGHTAAVKAISGVFDGMSITVPLGAGIHRRMVYIVLDKGADFKMVETAIKSDPYFTNDETVVMQVSDLAPITDFGHSTHITRKGVSGSTHNQRFSLEISIDNPAMTAQMMLSAARALQNRTSGAYTILHLSPIELLPGRTEALIRRLI